MRSLSFALKPNFIVLIILLAFFCVGSEPKDKTPTKERRGNATGDVAPFESTVSPTETKFRSAEGLSNVVDKTLNYTLTKDVTNNRGTTSADHRAQASHEQGSCSSMGPGTGLSGSSGWIVSMIPGKHEFRVRGGKGRVSLTAADLSNIDFDAGRPYYIRVDGASPNAAIEWKLPGGNWSVIPTVFLYPLSD